MDRVRFSRIAHADLEWAAPVDSDTASRAIAATGAGPGDQVLDVGCGRGAFLLELASRTGCTGLGLDIDAEAIRVAGLRADECGMGDRVRFEARDAGGLEPGGGFDVAICIGASHACGGYGPMLDYLLERTCPDARVLVGEGFWRKPPDEAYLRHLDADADEMGSHWDNFAVAKSRGLVPLWSMVSGDAAWDHYEGLYRLTMARYLARNPEDPEHDAFRDHSERWYDGYLKWGRETMGFALYLFGRAAR